MNFVNIVNLYIGYIGSNKPDGERGIPMPYIACSRCSRVHGVGQQFNPMDVSDMAGLAIRCTNITNNTIQGADGVTQGGPCVWKINGFRCQGHGQSKILPQNPQKESMWIVFRLRMS